ncbi:MAG: hypothetical protein WBB60_03250 [Nitrospira sp.]|nr:RHS repeat protein [Nitrospira sp.]HQY57682.1 hypothetical protein [Nitrospira sp.]HRA96144.1 hypothetical protein [Nitrospira sp.]
MHQLTATSTPMNQADYVYNPVGNRTSLTDRRGNQAFGYDQMDRLTSASHPLLLDPQAFAYAPVGNRTTGGTVGNTGNQLTADANFAHQYDDNGNLTRRKKRPRLFGAHVSVLQWRLAGSVCAAVRRPGRLSQYTWSGV